MSTLISVVIPVHNAPVSLGRCLMYLVLLLAPFYWPASAISLLITIALKHRFYRFLARKRGVWFAICSVPLHLAYFLYSGAAFVVGCVKALGSARG